MNLGEILWIAMQVFFLLLVVMGMIIIFLAIGIGTFQGFRRVSSRGKEINYPRPSEATFNRAAQRFYETSGLGMSHTSKPEVVAGLKGAWPVLTGEDRSYG